MNEFKIGDVVLLKSGSPKMTIKTIKEDGNIECCWYEDKHGILTELFDSSMLKLYKAPKGPSFRAI